MDHGGVCHDLGWRRGLAEASCTGSAAWVVVPPIATGPVASVVWRIEPACDVIETGLLIGTDLNALAPAGQPIYGYREIYRQEISVAETGTYWIMAYARDEGGHVIQSAPQSILIMVPPPEFTHGSHGGITSFTGTDEDFLKPAGEPHFASLKENNRTLRTQAASRFSQFTRESRGIGSTDRDAVLSQQLAPLQVGPENFTFSAFPLNAFLDNLDLFFSRSGFPRSGLYIVVCEGSLFTGGTALFRDSSCRPVFGARLDFADHIEEQIGADGSIVSTQRDSTHSSVIFFIPKSPTGKRVQTARLRALVGARASPDIIPSGLLLNGKPPWR